MKDSEEPLIGKRLQITPSYRIGRRQNWIEGISSRQEKHYFWEISFADSKPLLSISCLNSYLS
ncbi:MAG: hypothetical protein ACYSWW_18435, partial [Planctomycetota bacterium]